ncbi:MAG: alkyl hydroperoxide reductase [Gammaproteobacteria bacterium RIFCSPHIGHO2_12_FULL_45_12]|nr:MAG: alkyl hydroperoxide reductase [Gammaproteobacteria bacterium RIFCSPHIGHO2_12_FULL_45_12]
MAETASRMIPIGTKAPDFILLNTQTGQHQSLQSLKSEVATVVLFICNHCPYVKHMQGKLVDVANHYQSKNIAFIAISSNDASRYPEDGPAAMQKEAKLHHYPFPYLYDETQQTAKAYQAACTPDFFIFNAELQCVYRGRFDDSTPGNGLPVTGKDLSAALNNLLLGKPVSSDQKHSLGCNIKWK